MGDEICHYSDQRDENERPLTVMTVLRKPGRFDCEIVQDAPSGEEEHKQDRIQEQYPLHIETEIWCRETKTIQRTIGYGIGLSNQPPEGDKFY